MPRTGRRPGPARTRERILGAARTQFGREGYDKATLREIAAGAGVDPALIPHYFGSKEGVFLAAVEFPVDPALFIPRLLEPGVEGLGERLVTFFLETWDSPAGSSLLALIRSVVSWAGLRSRSSWISRSCARAWWPRSSWDWRCCGT